MPKYRYIYVLRHAKTETGRAELSDHARALTEEGIAAAEALGAFLKTDIAARCGNKTSPDLTLCSTARRTCQTFEIISQAFSHALPVMFSEKLYLAEAEDILKQVQEVEDSHRVLLVVGHNPGIHQFAVQLVGDGDDDLLENLSLHFPTGALAVLAVPDAPWSELAPKDALLQKFVTPKQLAASSRKVSG